MIEIEKYAQAAASTARTPPNSPARRAALEAENAARVAAEQFVNGLEAALKTVHEQVDDWHRKAIETREERNALRARLDASKADSAAAWARYENANRLQVSLQMERAEMRAKYDELLVALHGIGAALGIPEGDRSPYSVTCGVLERVNRLAEIEAQEPVAISKAGNLFWAGDPQDWRGVNCSLFTNPVPAQAVPDGWRLVPDRRVTAKMVRAGEMAWAAKERDMSHPTPTEFPEGGPAEACFFAMVAAAPEHKA